MDCLSLWGQSELLFQKAHRPFLIVQFQAEEIHAGLQVVRVQIHVRLTCGVPCFSAGADELAERVQHFPMAVGGFGQPKVEVQLGSRWVRVQPEMREIRLVHAAVGSSHELEPEVAGNM